MNGQDKSDICLSPFPRNPQCRPGSHRGLELHERGEHQGFAPAGNQLWLEIRPVDIERQHGVVQCHVPKGENAACADPCEPGEAIGPQAIRWAV
jgi:hypothetical protein